MLEKGYVCNSDNDAALLIDSVIGAEGTSDVDVEEEPRRDGRPLPFLLRSVLEEVWRRPSPNLSTSSPSLIVSKAAKGLRARDDRRLFRTITKNNLQISCL